MFGKLPDFEFFHKIIHEFWFSGDITETPTVSSTGENERGKFSSEFCNCSGVKNYYKNNE